MARETKISLLVGMVIILLIGILVSDHLSSANKQGHGSLQDFGPKAQKSVAGDIGRADQAPVIPMPPGTVEGDATFGDSPRGQNAFDPQAPSRMVVPPPMGTDDGLGAGLTQAGRIGQKTGKGFF